MPSFVVYSWMVYRPSHRGRAYHQGISSSPAHRQPTIQRNVFLEIEMNKNHERVKKKLSVHDFSILVAAVPPTPMNWLLYKNWTRTGVCSKNKRSWLQRPASRPGGPAAETNEMPFNMITLLKYTKVKNWTRTGVCSHFFSFFQFCFCLELLDLEGGQKMQVWVLFCVFSSLNRKLLKVGNWILLRYTEHFVKFKKVELVKSRFFCH